MKKNIFLWMLSLLILSSACQSSQQEVEQPDLESLKEEVWEVVEKRNATWAANDSTGHFALYHPEFLRWSVRKPTLLNRRTFASFWDQIKQNEKVSNIEVDREEVQILDGGKVAIAHYTIDESYEWIGDEYVNAYGDTITKGQINQGNLRFSDIYVKEGDQWLYIGGHRDGAGLEKE